MVTELCGGPKHGDVFRNVIVGWMQIVVGTVRAYKALTF